MLKPKALKPGGRMAAVPYNPGLNERIHFQEELKKLTRSNGSKIGDATFKPFYVVENEPKRETYLIHYNSSGKVKITRLQDAMCKVSTVPAEDKDFGQLPSCLQIHFANDKLPQVYQSRDEKFELWCRALQYILKKYESLPLMPVYVRRGLLRSFCGPALVNIQEGRIIIIQPSTMAAQSSIPILKLVSFGTNRQDVWFRVCHACARILCSDSARPVIEYALGTECDLAATAFIARLREEGHALTAGVMRMGKGPQGFESYLLNHTEVCAAAGLWDIRLDSDFVERTIAVEFSKTWRALAQAANFSSEAIRTYDDLGGGTRSAGHFLLSWLSRLPHDPSKSEPRALLDLAMAAGLTSEVSSLRQLFLDPDHANFQARTQSPGMPRRYDPGHANRQARTQSPGMPRRYDPAHEIPQERTQSPGMHRRCPQLPFHDPANEERTQSPGMHRRCPQPPFHECDPLRPDMPLADPRIQPAAQPRRMMDFNHPLCKHKLADLAFRVEDKYPDRWELLALKLVTEDTLDYIQETHRDATRGKRLDFCLDEWKSGWKSGRGLLEPTAHNLIKALEESGMPDLAEHYRGHKDLAYMTSGVGSPSQSPSLSKHRGNTPHPEQSDRPKMALPNEAPTTQRDRAITSTGRSSASAEDTTHAGAILPRKEGNQPPKQLRGAPSESPPVPRHRPGARGSSAITFSSALPPHHNEHGRSPLVDEPDFLPMSPPADSSYDTPLSLMLSAACLPCDGDSDTASSNMAEDFPMPDTGAVPAGPYVNYSNMSAGIRVPEAPEEDDPSDGSVDRPAPVPRLPRQSRSHSGPPATTAGYMNAPARQPAALPDDRETGYTVFQKLPPGK